MDLRTPARVDRSSLPVGALRRYLRMPPPRQIQPFRPSSPKRDAPSTSPPFRVERPRLGHGAFRPRIYQDLVLDHALTGPMTRPSGAFGASSDGDFRCANTKRIAPSPPAVFVK